MLRKIGFLVLVGLLAAAAPVRVDNAYEIKFKKNYKGSVTQHKKEDADEVHVKFEGPDGKVFSEKKDSEAAIAEYKETILERVKGKRATKIRREYTKAIVKINNKESSLAFDGKTVLIEKKDGKYHFTIVGGEELNGKDAEEFDRLFNKLDFDDSESTEMEKIILPKKSVPVNGTWKIDSEDFLMSFAKDFSQPFPMDKSKITGQGKLLRVYKKDGRQYGVFEVQIAAPLKGDFPLSKDQNAPIQEGSKMTFQVNVDGCIDGSLNDYVSDTSMNIQLVALIKTADGEETKMNLKISRKIKETEKDLSDK